MTTFPCTESPHLFDSSGGPTHPDVIAAKAICAPCPDRADCLAQGREGREWGVWGGESEPERHLAGYPVPDFSASRPACGTSTALLLHRKLGERCEECSEAKRVRDREYDKKRKRNPRVKLSMRPHIGTAQGYKLHGKQGDSDKSGACGCRAANTVARAEERARKKQRRELVAA